MNAFRGLPVLVVFASVLACRSASTPRLDSIEAASTCPLEHVGETELDCPWAGLARALQKDAADGRPISAALRTRAPALMASILSERDHVDVLALWGRSLNFDELAHETIVSEPLLDAIDELAGAEKRCGRVSHAGLEHTYGYLLSTLPTSFGFKRARWVNPDIEEGFGLPRGTLGPEPPGSTLLDNVSFLAGRIAFRYDDNERAAVQRASRVSSALRELAFESLDISRLEETVETPAIASGITIRTDFVRFPRGSSASPTAYSHLLVYSVARPSGGELVSLFPVTASFVEKTLDARTLGPHRAIALRYNGYLTELHGMPTIMGTRAVRPKRTSVD